MEPAAPGARVRAAKAPVNTKDRWNRVHVPGIAPGLESPRAGSSDADNAPNRIQDRPPFETPMAGGMKPKPAGLPRAATARAYTPLAAETRRQPRPAASSPAISDTRSLTSFVLHPASGYPTREEAPARKGACARCAPRKSTSAAQKYERRAKVRAPRKSMGPTRVLTGPCKVYRGDRYYWLV